MPYLDRALDAFNDWPLRKSLFYRQCSDCDTELFADTPCYFELDGDIDPEGYHYDCSTWLCVECAEKRGY